LRFPPIHPYKLLNDFGFAGTDPGTDPCDDPGCGTDPCDDTGNDPDVDESPKAPPFILREPRDFFIVFLRIDFAIIYTIYRQNSLEILF